MISPRLHTPLLLPLSRAAHRYYNSPTKEATKLDPRTHNLGHELLDEFAVLKENYRTPKNPVVLCHGLMGFDKLRIAGELLPGVEYWRGISECLEARGVDVITTVVPPTSEISVRAEALAEGIGAAAKGRSVNLIGHSMGGIDARYMISKLNPTDFKVLSLTTVATPHHGSSFADYMLDTIGTTRLPRVYNLLNSVGLQTGAFDQLTTSYMTQTFNRTINNNPEVSYFSYGARCNPPVYSVWYYPHSIIQEREGPNDGLVSVASSRWGTYEGTLVGVNHLGIINWVNRLEYAYGRLLRRRKTFNALAFYCGIIGRCP